MRNIRNANHTRGRPHVRGVAFWNPCSQPRAALFKAAASRLELRLSLSCPLEPAAMTSHQVPIGRSYISLMMLLCLLKLLSIISARGTPCTSADGQMVESSSKMASQTSGRKLKKSRKIIQDGQFYFSCSLYFSTKQTVILSSSCFFNLFSSLQQP